MLDLNTFPPSRTWPHHKITPTNRALLVTSYVTLDSVALSVESAFGICGSAISATRTMMTMAAAERRSHYYTHTTPTRTSSPNPTTNNSNWNTNDPSLFYSLACLRLRLHSRHKQLISSSCISSTHQHQSSSITILYQDIHNLHQ